MAPAQLFTSWVENARQSVNVGKLATVFEQLADVQP
jgi:hypothetical protein